MCVLRKHRKEMFPELSGTQNETGDDVLSQSVSGCFDLIFGGFDVHSFIEEP